MVDATRLAVVAPLHHLWLIRDSSRFLLCLRPSRIARQVLYGHAKSIGCHWLHVTPLKTSQRLTCGFHCPDGGTNGFVRDCAPAVSNLVSRFISPHTLTGAATGAGSFMLPDRERSFRCHRPGHSTHTEIGPSPLIRGLLVSLTRGNPEEFRAGRQVCLSVTTCRMAGHCSIRPKLDGD